MLAFGTWWMYRFSLDASAADSSERKETDVDEADSSQRKEGF